MRDLVSILNAKGIGRPAFINRRIVARDNGGHVSMHNTYGEGERNKCRR